MRSCLPARHDASSAAPACTPRLVHARELQTSRHAVLTPACTEIALPFDQLEPVPALTVTSGRSCGMGHSANSSPIAWSNSRTQQSSWQLTTAADTSCSNNRSGGHHGQITPCSHLLEDIPGCGLMRTFAAFSMHCTGRQAAAPRTCHAALCTGCAPFYTSASSDTTSKWDCAHDSHASMQHQKIFACSQWSTSQVAPGADN